MLATLAMVAGRKKPKPQAMHLLLHSNAIDKLQAKTNITK